jgi:putative membrane protein
MAKSFTMAATAMIAVMLAGCSQKANDQAADVGNGAANATASTGNALSNAAGAVKDAVTPTPTAQEFVDKAAKSDAFEIASAKLAEKSASSAEIKSFASMMIKDHTASTAKIKAAAAKASPAIKPDPTLTEDQNGNLSDLKALKGADFDKKYADQQIDAHRSALSLMRLYSDKGDVTPLKGAAGEILPKVETHLEQIKSIKDKL